MFFFCRVLQLMNLTDTRLQVSGGCEKLELAMLSFFEQFRKIYVGDQVSCQLFLRHSFLFAYIVNVVIYKFIYLF